MRYKAYISYAMEHEGDFSWKERVVDTLENKLGIEVLDPADNNVPNMCKLLTDYRASGDFASIRNAFQNWIMQQDIKKLACCDITISFYNQKMQKGAGGISEAWEAFVRGKPLYLVSTDDLNNIPFWLIGCTTQIFTNEEDLFSYLKSTEQLQEDQRQADEKAREFSEVARGRHSNKLD